MVGARKSSSTSVAKLLKSISDVESAASKCRALAKKVPKTGTKRVARKKRRTVGGSYEIEGGKPKKKRSTKKKTGLKVTRTKKRRTTKKKTK
jgi:hypothetical protein